MQDAALRHAAHEALVELVVHDLARLLEVARADGLVHAVALVAAPVPLLRPVPCAPRLPDAMVYSKRPMQLATEPSASKIAC